MKRYRMAYRVALVTAAATFALIVLGGVVYNTGSSLACPDWPLCYGSALPAMFGKSALPGVIYEHSHRLLAATVGLCSILLCGLLWPRAEGGPRPAAPGLRRAALALPLLVLFQGVLGGLVVIYKLPTLVRAGHLAVSMIVLLTLIYLCRALKIATNDELPMTHENATGGADRRLYRTAFLMLAMTTGLVYLQLLLGALVRHTESSAAAGWGWAGALIGIDPLTGRYTMWPGDRAAQLNVMHRYAALAVAAVVTLYCTRCWGLLSGRLDRRGTRLVWLPVALVMLQLLVGVGMLTTWDLKIYPGLHISSIGASWVQVGMRTLHLAVGTLLLGSLGLLTASMRQRVKGEV